MLPFWTSFLVRTCLDVSVARYRACQYDAVVASSDPRPLPLLYNDGAVMLGLVYGDLPFMVLPLYATLEKLDPALLEAARISARPVGYILARHRAARRPGSWPAVLLVFIPCLGAYLTPDLLGGGQTVMVGNLVQNQFTTARDWPFGSAVSLVLMVLVVTAAVAGRFLRQGKRVDMKRWLAVYAAAFYAFLHVPLLMLAVFSFNSLAFHGVGGFFACAGTGARCTIRRWWKGP